MTTTIPVINTHSMFDNLFIVINYTYTLTQHTRARLLHKFYFNKTSSSNHLLNNSVLFVICRSVDIFCKHILFAEIKRLMTRCSVKPLWSQICKQSSSHKKNQIIRLRKWRMRCDNCNLLNCKIVKSNNL